MIELYTYIKEGIFDEEGQMEDINRNSEGLNIAIKELKQNNKFFNRGSFATIIVNLNPDKKFGKVYRECIEKDFKQAEDFFVKTITSLFAGKCDNSLKFLHRILYKHLDEVFEYVRTKHEAGFGPMLRELPLNRFEKDELNTRQFKSYKDAYALLAWASPFSPMSNYMIKIPKDRDKYETEFMMELIKILYENND